MKLTFITNACAIYESQGFRLLSDPWFTPGAFGSWTHDPPLKTKIEDVLGVDAIYISHIHQDHLDPEALKHFRKDIPIVTLKDRLGITERKLKELGFECVVAIGDKMSTELVMPDAALHLFAPFTKHPFHDSDIGNVVDSALLIEAEGKKILNTNDNTPSLEAAEWLKKEYGPFDLVQLNWNNAGPFPACFTNLSHDEKLAAAKDCVQRNLGHMAKVAKILDAKYTMPFAGAYKLAFGYEHLNQYLGTCSAEEAGLFLSKYFGINAVWLKEGETLELD